MVTAILSFWVTDRKIDQSEYPTAEQLIVAAYHEFRKTYIEENRKYSVFLRRAFSSKEHHEVHYNDFIRTANYLVAQYYRAYDVLHDNRRKIIETFTKKPHLSILEARTLIEECELRGKYIEKQQPTPNNRLFTRLADCANTFGIFCDNITAEDLIGFVNARLNNPLRTDNIAKAVFFLSLMGIEELLPAQWKSHCVKHKLLTNAQTNAVPSANYLRTVANLYNVATIYSSVKVNTRNRILDIWERIALAFKQAVSD